MTKQQILKKLSDPTLDYITREQLQQHLHHINTQAKLVKTKKNKQQRKE